MVSTPETSSASMSLWRLEAGRGGGGCQLADQIPPVRSRGLLDLGL